MLDAKCSVECLALILTCKTGILLGTLQDCESQALVKWWLQSPGSGTLPLSASLHRGVPCGHRGGPGSQMGRHRPTGWQTPPAHQEESEQGSSPH